MKLKCTLEELKDYRDFLKKFRRHVVSEYLKLKEKCTTVDWDDDVYYKFVENMNEIGKEIAEALSAFTSDTQVPLLDELIRRLERYIAISNHFRNNLFFCNHN